MQNNNYHNTCVMLQHPYPVMLLHTPLIAVAITQMAARGAKIASIQLLFYFSNYRPQYRLFICCHSTPIYHKYIYWQSVIVTYLYHLLYILYIFKLSCITRYATLWNCTIYEMTRIYKFITYIILYPYDHYELADRRTDTTYIMPNIIYIYHIL